MGSSPVRKTGLQILFSLSLSLSIDREEWVWQQESLSLSIDREEWAWRQEAGRDLFFGNMTNVTLTAKMIFHLFSIISCCVYWIGPSGRKYMSWFHHPMKRCLQRTSPIFLVNK
ncbi:hypothetical protein O6H91_10G068400 [Diphasiastrum complanatum]|uniref:Uncharacterized protein n=1 Tax=Diphasiastrum complanatum TaxID=34168 RepID=A0ACC2CIE1_DIPCM|nr:hypothetical protein O6H91_10G068400 [Diphasiastrum complanatum]